jgi:hypothetical protein
MTSFERQKHITDILDKYFFFYIFSWEGKSPKIKLTKHLQRKMWRIVVEFSTNSFITISNML